MIKLLVFLVSGLACCLVWASRPSPYASYYQQVGSSWTKVAEVSYSYAEHDIVAKLVAGCAATMTPEGPYNFVGACLVRTGSSQFKIRVQLQLQKSGYYVLYIASEDPRNPSDTAKTLRAFPRYF